MTSAPSSTTTPGASTDRSTRPCTRHPGESNESSTVASPVTRAGGRVVALVTMGHAGSSRRKRGSGPRRSMWEAQ